MDLSQFVQGPQEVTAKYDLYAVSVRLEKLEIFLMIRFTLVLLEADTTLLMQRIRKTSSGTSSMIAVLAKSTNPK